VESEEIFPQEINKSKDIFQNSLPHNFIFDVKFKAKIGIFFICFCGINVLSCRGFTLKFVSELFLG